MPHGAQCGQIWWCCPRSQSCCSQSAHGASGNNSAEDGIAKSQNKTKNASAPARPPMKRKDYEGELRKLQVELCKLQDWVKYKGLRVIVVMEGRDGAGKGGTIKAITERVSPRVFRVVALPAPSDREKTQMYMQR